MKIKSAFNTGKHTLIEIPDAPPPSWRGNEIMIEGEKFSTEIVYDLPNHIAVIGKGDFEGKELEFI